MAEPVAGDIPDLHAATMLSADNLKFTQWRAGSSREDLAAAVLQESGSWGSPASKHAWILRDRETGQIVGLRTVRYERSAGTVKMSGLIGSAFRGRGYGPESMRRLIECYLEQPDFFRAQGTCDCENSASLRGMVKAGMAYEGRLRRYGVMPNVSPEPRDFFMYAATR